MLRDGAGSEGRSKKGVRELKTLHCPIYYNVRKAKVEGRGEEGVTNNLLCLNEDQPH